VKRIGEADVEYVEQIKSNLEERNHLLYNQTL